MNIDRETKEQLNALSKEVFGTASRWVKLVEKGYQKLVTEDVEETVPADENGEGGGVNVVQKPVLVANGAQQYVTERHTVASVQALMQKLKKQRDDYFAAVKELQARTKAEQEAKAQSDKLIKEAGGSVL